jgi:alpha-amylase
MKVSATDVILHAFDWSYATVAQHAQQISRAGYKAVLISPPMRSLSSPKGTPWWQRYQPQDYRVIDNQLGNTDDFKTMSEALHKEGLWLYVDVVFNHMANESTQRLDLDYPSEAVLAHYQKHHKRYERWRLFGDLAKPLFEECDFIEPFGIKDWHDKWEVQNGRITGGPHDQGLPTLKSCPHVIEQQQAYLRALKGLGVNGFRIDAAKHMTIDHLNAVWDEDICQDVHIFGEIITDGGASKEEYELFLAPYLEKTNLSAYDFPLFLTLYQSLMDDGDLSSLVDPYCFGLALSKYRAITFTITHDIPNNDVFRSLVMEPWQEHLAYAYILGRDGGVPLIYSDLNTSGIENSGQPRWQDAWQRDEMIAQIEFHNRMHSLPMIPIITEEKLLVFSRGDQGIVVLNSSEDPRQFTIEWNKNVSDIITGALFPAQESSLVLEVQGRSCLMLVDAPKN